ncbi:MAG: transposase [Cryomorphaceae bacterium]|jgi:transposase
MLLIIGVPMNQKRVYKSYPKEFKEEAVALVTDQGYSLSEAAESLGIRANQLYDWRAKIEASKLDGALSDDERGELKRLRKENKTLCIEKGILKKTSAFFAKEIKKVSIRSAQRRPINHG